MRASERCAHGLRCAIPACICYQSDKYKGSANVRGNNKERHGQASREGAREQATGVSSGERHQTGDDDERSDGSRRPRPRAARRRTGRARCAS